MEFQHIVAKIFVEGDLKIDPARCVDVFHRWVAQQSMPELLVDVAELLHVPDGPGMIVVGHEADYALDNTAGRWGVLYRRKAPLDGTNGERLAQALHSAAEAGRRLEEEFKGDLKFSRREFELIFNDRALTPNRPETFAACKPELEACLKGLLGHGDFQLAPHNADPRRRFGVTVKSSRPFEFAAAAGT